MSNGVDTTGAGPRLVRVDGPYLLTETGWAWMIRELEQGKTMPALARASGVSDKVFRLAVLAFCDCHLGMADVFALAKKRGRTCRERYRADKRTPVCRSEAPRPLTPEEKWGEALNGRSFTSMAVRSGTVQFAGTVGWMVR